MTFTRWISFGRQLPLRSSSDSLSAISSACSSAYLAIHFLRLPRAARCIAIRIFSLEAILSKILLTVFICLITSRALGFLLLARAFVGQFSLLRSVERYGHYSKIQDWEAPIFQFAFEGALLTLNANSPLATPLFTLPPDNKASAHTIPLMPALLLNATYLRRERFPPAPSLKSLYKTGRPRKPKTHTRAQWRRQTRTAHRQRRHSHRRRTTRP